jgi:hypothetical protein
MPTFAPFTAIGKGNGMPYCLPELVPAEGDWYFSGRTPAQQMRAYWKTHAIRFFAGWSATYIGDDDDQDPTFISAAPDVTAVMGAPGGTTPVNRLCGIDIMANQPVTMENPANMRWAMDDWGELSGGRGWRFDFEVTSRAENLGSIFVLYTTFTQPSPAHLLGTYTVNTGPWGQPFPIRAYVWEGLLSGWAFTLSGGIGFTVDEWVKA